MYKRQAIDMYLKPISLVGGIPFSIVLPKAANSVNADMMSATPVSYTHLDVYKRQPTGSVRLEERWNRFLAVRLRRKIYQS